MLTFLLQDWTTLQGLASTTFTQAETGWCDLAGFQDVVAWLDVKEFLPTGAGAPTIAYQTSPSQDEALFMAMTPPFALTTGLTVTRILKALAPTPLARWMRWQIFEGTGGAWSVTFRILLAANQTGNRSPRPDDAVSDCGCRHGGPSPVSMPGPKGSGGSVNNFPQGIGGGLNFISDIASPKQKQPGGGTPVLPTVQLGGAGYMIGDPNQGNGGPKPQQ
jgi:hypothetical protein